MSMVKQAGRAAVSTAGTALKLKVLGAGAAVVVVIVVPAMVIAAVLIGVVASGGSAASAGGGCTSVVGDSIVTAGKVPAQYVAGVNAAAAASGVPAPVIAAQIQAESNWNPNAASKVGARGLTQFMPATWTAYAPPGSDPSDPVAAMQAQGAYMRELLQLATAYKAKHPQVTSDAVSLALAGYNAGWGAVEAYGGIPPYRETQGYVARITASASSFSTSGAVQGSGAPAPALAPATASVSPQSAASESSSVPGATAGPAPQGGCVELGQGAPTSGKDDYPYRAQSKGVADPWAFYQTECVSFAAWRINQAMGTPSGKYAFTNGNGPRRMGSALDWKAGWQARGWPMGKTPIVGAVVWYAPDNHAGSVGHVAIVKSVSADGKTFVEEGYNGLPRPHDHTYYVREWPSTVPNEFLYLPGRSVPAGGGVKA